MPEEKHPENLESITGADLNETGRLSNEERTSGEQDSNKQELYKKEEQKVEQAIERTGEKLQQSSPTDDDSDEQEEAKYHANEVSKMNADDQVEYLVQVAINKDPYLAIRIAQEIQNNYVLSETYSDLTEDKIRNVLIEKKLL